MQKFSFVIADFSLKATSLQTELSVCLSVNISVYISCSKVQNHEGNLDILNIN